MWLRRSAVTTGGQVGTMNSELVFRELGDVPGKTGDEGAGGRQGLPRGESGV